MLIVDYDTFIRMPAGTIFAPYEPCVFKDEFEIKVDGGEEYVSTDGKKLYGFNGTMPLSPYLDLASPTVSTKPNSLCTTSIVMTRLSIRCLPFLNLAK